MTLHSEGDVYVMLECGYHGKISDKIKKNNYVQRSYPEEARLILYFLRGRDDIPFCCAARRIFRYDVQWPFVHQKVPACFRISVILTIG